MKIGFDLISDLNLDIDNQFTWENKATSLYCLLAGNVSSDLQILENALIELSKYYHGIFYVPGSLEFSNITDYKKHIVDLSNICSRMFNVAFLHHHAIIIDGIAILGCAGYYGTETQGDFESLHNVHRFEDFIYLKTVISRLQKHLDIKKIILITNAVPNNFLYFGKIPDSVEGLPELSMTIANDSEFKISHWVYGKYNDIVDIEMNGINYVCNPYNKIRPYYPKRINVEC